MSGYVFIVGVIESVILLLFCAYAAWQYAAKDRTPWYVYALTIFSWFLSYMIIFLIPMDIFMVSCIRFSTLPFLR
jgi:hypothetical protein